MAYLDECDIETVLLIDRLLTIRLLENHKKLLEENLTGTIPFPKPKGETMMMNDNEKRFTEATNNRLRARLKTVAALAENALANQPNGIDTCWEHLMGALGRIETEMLINNAEKPVGDSPAEAQSRREEKPFKPLDPNAPEMVRGGEPDEKKAIGNFAGVGKVVSYAIGRDMTVTVTANMTGDRVFTFKGIKNGETMIIGSIFGGKWQAAQYCKFLRNGIVSRAKKVWKNHHRRSEKAAAALADARSDAGKAVSE